MDFKDKHNLKSTIDFLTFFARKQNYEIKVWDFSNAGFGLWEQYRFNLSTMS